MAEFLHGYTTNHGPVFVFGGSQKPLQKGGTIRVTDWMGKVDPSVTARLKKVLDAKEFDTSEAERGALSPEAKTAAAALLRKIATELEKE